ncbi:GNAT family N-acetyltransferase [Streptomyces megasporus]|uniref:GNAT family N-acetyltransferase n=1 Tax=Streptomyces megasporus TaxID=44060 RepID=UPI0004E264C2|nr:GNAT family N-acetyltransferase [Streptomyces megasporus]
MPTSDHTTSATHAVRPATHEDVPRAVRTLERAFADYPATRHTISADDHGRRVREAQELILTRVGLEYGRVWVAADGDAVAVWTTPEKDPTPAFVEIGPRMGELAGDRLHAQQESERLVAPHRPTEPVWFLATVAVDPDRQGQGLGTAVIRPGLEEADRAGVPAFLETADERNVRLYRRFGFEVTADIDIPDGPRTWCMRRAPRS